MKSKVEQIQDTVDRIYANDDEELLGFTIAQATNESDNNYMDIGKHVLYIFRSYPEQAEILDKMLVAITGWSITSLEDEMEDERDYFDSL